jgi:DNA-binding transcriptional ArsR family regulator
MSRNVRTLTPARLARSRWLIPARTRCATINSPKVSVNSPPGKPQPPRPAHYRLAEWFPPVSADVTRGTTFAQLIGSWRADEHVHGVHVGSSANAAGLPRLGNLLGGKGIMLRIYFSTEDLARVRVPAEPHPMWELLLSLHLVQTTQGDAVFGPWRHRQRSLITPLTGMLTTLARPKGYSPDFLTPAGDVPDLDAGLDLLLSTPRSQLRADITELAEQADVPGWAAGIANGERDVMRQLAGAVRKYHADALRPYWPSLRQHVRADRNRRAEISTTSGVESVLKTLHPTVTWNAPVLEVAYPVDQELHLQGRGLVLTPSFFCWQTPITLADQSLHPTLVYPIDHDLDWAAIPGEEGDRRIAHARSLSALLGQTRATVLRTIADRRHLNTTDLARAIGISLSGASQHATVLRNAGLITTSWQQGSAIHRVSSLGAALLQG